MGLQPPISYVEYSKRYKQRNTNVIVHAPIGNYEL